MSKQMLKNYRKSMNNENKYAMTTQTMTEQKRWIRDVRRFSRGKEYRISDINILASAEKYQCTDICNK